MNWEPVTQFAREVIASARKHGFEKVRVECRPNIFNEYHDSITIDWDGERHGENTQFHIAATEHHYAKENDNSTL